MNKVLVIARREFNAMVATKAFMLTLVMMPVLMLGGIVLMPALSRLGGTKHHKIVVADETGTLFPLIEQAAEQRNQAIQQADESDSDDGNDNPFEAAEVWQFELAAGPTLSDEQRIQLSDQIRDGSLHAFVELPAELQNLANPQPIAINFVGQNAMMSGARRWLENFLTQELRQQRLQEFGIDPELVGRASTPIQLTPASPYKRGEDGTAQRNDVKDMLVTMLLPFGVMMLMFLVIMLAAQPMLESAMEEKRGRVAELLLGSVTTTQLMTGKLLGNVAGSFVIFLIYGVGGFVVIYRNDWGIDLPWTLMPWLILFQVLGVLFFSSIFLTIGASVSELKEAQSLLLPVWLLLVFPMMVWFVVVRDPNGTVATSLSFFPPTTPLMMSLRLSTGQTIAWWQPILAASVMLVSTMGVVMVAGRIYRVSLLNNDSAKSLVQLFTRLRG